MKVTLNLRKDYTTHMPMLIRAVQATRGPVLELGAGVFSTPLLHWLCATDRRRLETYEDDKGIFEFANKFRSGNHKVHLVEDWDRIEIDKHWDVVLVDHGGDRRGVDALRLKDNAHYIVLHDSETDIYGYSGVYPHFRYIHHWKACRPWTTVLSNYMVGSWN